MSNTNTMIFFDDVLKKNIPALPKKSLGVFLLRGEYEPHAILMVHHLKSSPQSLSP